MTASIQTPSAVSFRSVSYDRKITGNRKVFTQIAPTDHGFIIAYDDVQKTPASVATFREAAIRISQQEAKAMSRAIIAAIARRPDLSYFRVTLAGKQEEIAILVPPNRVDAIYNCISRAEDMAPA